MTARQGRSGAYVVLAATDTALAAAGVGAPRWLTKPLLMPVLAVGRDRPTQRALALCWLGDVALLGRGSAAFSAGLGSFLAGHVAWLTAFRQRPSRRLVRRHPALAVPYIAAFGGLNAHLWNRTGRDRLPVVLYSAVLATMAVAALDTGRKATAVGGALFVVSDSLLALHRFADVEPPCHEGLVMATYTAAQAMLTMESRSPVTDNDRVDRRVSRRRRPV